MVLLVFTFNKNYSIEFSSLLNIFPVRSFTSVPINIILRYSM